MRDTFVRSLKVRAECDPNIFMMVGDLGFGVIDSFAEDLPQQFLNAGIAEQNMMGMAAGLADTGFLPFVYSIANFPTLRCLEQIRNDVCYHNLPVSIVSIGAGMGYGTLGYSHFAIEDLAILRALPGMRILSPSDPVEVEACLDLILADPGPTYLRLGKNGEKVIHEAPVDVSEGTLSIRAGKDYLILVTGSIAEEVLKAANTVANDQGVEFEVRTVPIIKPLNLGGVDLKNYEKVFIVEEHSVVGGLGSAVLEHANDLGLSTEISRIGLKDVISSEIGSTSFLRAKMGLDAESLAVKFGNLPKRN